MIKLGTDPFPSELARRGFSKVDNDVFQKGQPLRHTVAIVGGELFLDVSIFDPFRNDTEPFYVSCFLGEVDAGGVTTKSAFLTTYERVQAQLGAGVAEELTHCKLWLDRYSGLTEVARLFEDAFRKRQTKSAEQKGLLGRIAAEIRVGKPSRPYPPIYDYVQSLLQFHLKNYSQSLAHAEKYAAIFTDESEASDRQRMERMIESIRQKL